MKYSVNITVEFNSMVEMDQVSHAAVEIMRQRGGKITCYSRTAFELDGTGDPIPSPQYGATDETQTDDAGGETQPAVAGQAAPRTRKPRAQKPAVVAAETSSAPADAAGKPNADDVSGSTQSPQQGGSESVAVAGDAEDASDVVEVSWSDFVAVMNKVSGKGIDVARKLLNDHGVNRAIDLKDDSKALERGKIVAAATKVLA